MVEVQRGEKIKKGFVVGLCRIFSALKGQNISAQGEAL